MDKPLTEEEEREKREMKNYLEGQEALADQLKKQLHEHKQQITSKENILAEMKTLHARALEKRNAELEQINLERTLITDMEMSIIEESEKNEMLSNLVKNQETIIGDLEEQVDQFKVKMEEKEGELDETKKELTKKLVETEEVNEKLNKQLEENKSRIVEQAKHMEEVNQHHLKALKRLEGDLEQITLEKAACVSDFQQSLETENEKKGELNNFVADQKAVIDQLENRINEYKKKVDDQEQKMKENERHHEKMMVERNELVAQKERDYRKKIEEKENAARESEKNYKKKIKEKEELLEENEEKFKKKLGEKEKLLSEREKEYKTMIMEKDLLVHEKELERRKQLDEKSKLLNETERELKQKMDSHEKQFQDREKELQKKIEEKDKLLDEMEHECRRKMEEKDAVLKNNESEHDKEVNTLKGLNKEYLKQLNEKMGELVQLENQMNEASIRHTQALENLQCELEQTTLDKSSRISDLEDSLCGEIKAKNMLDEFIENQKGVMSDMERQLNEYKLQVSDKENILKEREEEYTNKYESQEKINEDLMAQLEVSKRNIAEQEVCMIELDAQHTDALEKLQEDLDRVATDQTNYINDLETSIATLKEEKNILSTVVEGQKQMMDDLHRQLDKSRNRAEQSEDELRRKEEEFKRKSRNQEEVMGEQLKKICEHKATLEKQENHLIELNTKHTQALEKLQYDLEQIVMKKMSYIADVEKKLEMEVQNNKELNNSINRMKDVVADVERQLQKSRDEITRKEQLLVEQKEKNSKDIEKLESVLIEADAQHKEEYEKLKNNLEGVICEKSSFIGDLEKSFEEESEKKDTLTNYVKNQENVIKNLNKQISEQNVKIAEMEQELIKLKEDYVKMIEMKEALIVEHLNEIEANKEKIAQQEIDAFEKDIQHGRALENLQQNLEKVASDKTAYITELEKSLKSESNQKNKSNKLLEGQKSTIVELEKKLNELNSRLQNQEALFDKARHEYMREAKAQKAVNVEYLRQLNEHESTITQKENNLIKMESVHVQKMQNMKEEIESLEQEKEALIDTVKTLEDDVFINRRELNEKTEQLNQLLKTHQQAQLDHINELKNLNTEHRRQLASLMDVPTKNKNVKALLLNLQKEADEVLDLMISVPNMIDERPVVVKECNFVQMSHDDLSTAEMYLDDLDDGSMGSVMLLQAGDVDEKNNNQNSNDNSKENIFKGNKSMEVNRLVVTHDPPADTSVNDGISLKHGKQVLVEFEKLLSEESDKVQMLRLKLDEETRRRENTQLSHEGELRQIVERELKLKDKYLKLSEHLEKEKKGKNRLMAMLSDAQKLNEMQAKNLEEVMNDKNALLESYAMVTELENLLAEEKERSDAINSKFERERYQKVEMQNSLVDEKAELEASKGREQELEENCRKLKKLLENEVVERRSVASALEYEKNLISMEKKNLEQKQFAMSQKLSGLGNETLSGKINSLKAWEGEMKKREKFVIEKEQKVRNLIGKIEKGYDPVPEKDGGDGIEDNGSKTQNDQMDIRHLPLVADLNQKVNTLQKEKLKLAEDLNSLTAEIGEYKRELREYKNDMGENGRTDAITQNKSTVDGEKLVNAGWTIAKVQRLYLKYFRSESFRKALIYQKRYLGMLLNTEKKAAIVTTDIVITTVKHSLKGVALTVIAVSRMKYLVQKYHRQLYKSSPEYPYKEKVKNITKKLTLECEDEIQPQITKTELTEKANAEPGAENVPVKPVLGTSTINSSPKPRQSNLASVSSRLATSEPSINRLHLSNRSLERSIDWLNRPDVTVATQHGAPLTRSLNEQHLRRPATSPVKNVTGCTGIPRSYPRSPGVVDEFPSKLSSLNNASKSPLRTHLSQVTSSPLPKSRDVVDNKDNTNESLSNYIEGLEALHNRLRTVGYNEQGKPCLL